jgi:hypothetical protein
MLPDSFPDPDPADDGGEPDDGLPQETYVPPRDDGAQQAHRREASRGLIYAGIAALVLITGCTTYALAAHRTASAAKPLTCEQHYANWKTGQANAPGE